ncbi:MAG: Ig domain-containing protein, partial [Acidimicrobiales bacterium]
GAATFRAYNLTVNPALTITSPAALDDWTVGRPYTAVTATAAGGSGTRTWSATGLPPGLTINATTGDISGTPTAAGSYSYTIRVTDSVGTTATLAGNVTINPVLAISTASLPNWTFNRPYTPVTLTTSGGTGAVTWSATNLPTGLSLSAAGTLTGTPTATGTRTVNVTATDSTGSIANRSYTMVISVAPAISTASLPNWTANRAYTTAVVATGGTTAYTWSATGMPPGLSINSGSGVISGNPTTPGAYSVNVIVTDAAGATANRTYPVTINAGLQVSAPLFLSDWTVNRAYTSVTFNATGGTGTKTWSASGLPTGLAINAGGVLTGTPTAVGSYPYTVTVTDAAGATAQMSGTVFINPALSVTAPASLPNWTAGLAYLPVTMSSSGGTGTVSWSASGLPAGLTISTAGVISGTPTATGPFTATITATDFVGATAPRSYTFTVNPALNISTATLPAGTVGRPYSQALSSTGGTGAKTWSGSGLPTGLSINAAGVISGTPTVAGTFGSISVTVTDTVGATTVKGFSVTIYTAPTISAPAALPNGSSGLAYSSTATATGGSGVYTWSATGLPPGLTMAATGQISGTPTTSGSYTVTVTVTDSTTLATANMVYNNVAITPRVTNVVLTGGNGIASTNDSVVITLSEAVNPATLCAGWDGTSRSVTVTISGTDMLTVSGCTTLGTLALGGDYVTTTATFSGNGGNASTIAWSAATNTVTITLGKLNTGAVNGIAVPPGTPTYTPNAAMTTASGVPFGTTPFTPAASSRF